jgi:N-acetyl sugar amidotransferase
MRVLFISSGNSGNRNTPTELNQGRSLQKSGFEVEYYIIKGKGLSGYAKNIFLLRKYLKTNHYQIHHAHYSLSAFVASLAGARPLAVSLMGSDVKSGFFFRLPIYIFRFIFSWKAIIVKSADMRNSLKITNLNIIPNGVNLEQFTPDKKDKYQNLLGWDPTKKHILFAANRDQHVKNFPMAMEAIKLLNNPHIELHILKNVPHEEMHMQYNATDIVILTSLWEGSPNVIKEAMACNRPVVSTKVGDIEWLFGDQAGHFVCEFNAEDLAEKITLALSYSSLSTSTDGRSRIIKLGLDSNSVAKKLVKLYKILLEDKKSKKAVILDNYSVEKTKSKLAVNPSEPHICSIGIWDSSVPGIKFDADRESNFCKMQKSLLAQYPRGEKGMHDWSSLVSQMKHDGRKKAYDCIVGVSGGTDSSYLLYIAKQYNLRALAVNLDNGWSSDIAVSNIKTMTDALNYDLETYVIDYEEVKCVLRSYILAGMPWIDSPTDIAIKSALYKIASREGIKYILNGSDFRSEGKQPLSWTYSDTRQLKYLVKKFGKCKLKTYPLQPLSSWFYYGFIKKIKVVRPLYYLPYNKKDAKSLLSVKYGWIDYGGHHHENIFTKFAISYWLPVKFGIDKRIITLSAQVLSGELLREEALNIISMPSFDKLKIEDDIDYVLKKMDLTRNEFNDIFNADNKSFFNYPSYYPMIKKFSGIGKFVTSKIFGFKPGVLEAIDQNI